MLKHVGQLVWGAVIEAFYLVPDFVALFLTAFGVAVIFMNETLRKLENRPRWRSAIIVCFIAFGALAFLSNQVQKGQDNRDKHELAHQITILLNGIQVEATSSDVHNLAAEISSGFERLEGDIRPSTTLPVRPIKPQVASPKSQEPPPSAAPQSIRFTQKRVPSTNPEYPYALQVIIQSDVTITPVGLAINFSGPINDIRFFLAGQSAMMMVQSFVEDQNSNVGVVRVGYPPLTPDSPIVVSVLSKESVSVTSIDKISAAMNGSLTPE